MIDADWRIRFLGFVRRVNVKPANERFAPLAEVFFFALEDAAFSFAYWTERERGLPRCPREVDALPDEAL